jgi:hypothetical protein
MAWWIPRKRRESQLGGLVRDSEGVEVRLGDRVRIFDVDTGVVVFSIDKDEYSAEFPKEDWNSIK